MLRKGKEGSISLSIFQANCLFHYTTLTPRSSESLLHKRIHPIWKASATGFDIYQNCGMEKVNVSQTLWTHSIQIVLTRLDRLKAAQHKGALHFALLPDFLASWNPHLPFFTGFDSHRLLWLLAWHRSPRRQYFAQAIHPHHRCQLRLGCAARLLDPVTLLHSWGRILQELHLKEKIQPQCHQTCHLTLEEDGRSPL